MPDDDLRAKVRYAATVLADFRRRCRESGVAMPMQLEALAALLANDRPAAPNVAEQETGPLLLTYESAARLLSVSPRTLSRMVSDGRLPTVEVGGGRIAAGDLTGFVETLPRRKGVRGADDGEASDRDPAGSGVPPAG